MKISDAIDFCLQYQEANSKDNTIKNYGFVLGKFAGAFNGRELESIKTEEVITFLAELSSGRKQSTKRGRYMTLSAFFNLIINTLQPDMRNLVILQRQEIFSENPKPINGPSLIKTPLMRLFSERSMPATG